MLFMTDSLNVMPKTTEHNLIVHTGESEAEITNNRCTGDEGTDQNGPSPNGPNEGRKRPTETKTAPTKTAPIKEKQDQNGPS